MSNYKHKPLDTGDIKRYSLKDRASKVSVESFAKKYSKGFSFNNFAGSLPDFLAVKELREVSLRIVNAYNAGRGIVLGMGAHPIKVGLNPLLIQWMESGLLSGLAMNGAGIIHDFEIAFHGATSEEVGNVLDDGSFGMAEETGKDLNLYINDGVKAGLGIGESVGKGIYDSDLKYKELSLLYNAYRLNIPVTVHVAVGTDIIHFHPEVDAAALGEGTHRDFLLLADVCRGLENGGVFINLGSAVILPEVFLKIVSLLRNLGTPLEKLYTLNMDFTRQYRPATNVTRRPTMKGGKGYTLIGHHEIMFPLLTAMVMEKMK